MSQGTCPVSIPTDSPRLVSFVLHVLCRYRKLARNKGGSNAITRPSPVPEPPLVVKKRTAKMCGRVSGAIPLPLCAISTRKNSPSRRVRISMRPLPPTA